MRYGRGWISHTPMKYQKEYPRVVVVEGCVSTLEPSLEAKQFSYCKTIEKKKKVLKRSIISKKNMNLQLTNQIAPHNSRFISAPRRFI